METNFLYTCQSTVTPSLNGRHNFRRRRPRSSLGKGKCSLGSEGTSSRQVPDSSRLPDYQGTDFQDLGHLANTDTADDILRGGYRYPADMEKGTESLLQEATRLYAKNKGIINYILKNDNFSSFWNTLLKVLPLTQVLTCTKKGFLLFLLVAELGNQPCT